MAKRMLGRKLYGEDDSVFSLIVPPGLRQHHQANRQGDTLLSEQVRMLYSNLPASIIVSVLLALILITVQVSVVDQAHLLVWSVLFGLAMIGRTMLFFIWRRMAHTASRSNERRLLHWFRVGAIATGIVWGLGGVLLTSSGDYGHKVYVAFVLAGLCAGAAITLAIDAISVVGFMLSALMPYILLLFAAGDAVSLDMGAMVILFLLFVLASARQSGLQVRENFHLRQKAIENGVRLSAMLESSPIAARIEDIASNRVVFANNSYISLINSTSGQVIGVTPSNYYAHPEEYAEVMQRLGKGEQVNNMLVELHGPDGDAWTKWALASIFRWITRMNRRSSAGFMILPTARSWRSKSST